MPKAKIQKIQAKKPKAQKSKVKKAHINKPNAKPAKTQTAKTQKAKSPAAKTQAEKTSPAKISQINLPSKSECDEMMKRWGLPDNIMRHSLQVNRVSMFIAKKLKDTGMKINLQLVDKGSLLHDLDKIRTLKTDQHGIVAEEFLTNKGFPEVGQIAKLHRFSFIKDDTIPWEAKIVNYADKRVKHDKIVSLQDRFADLLMRYDVKTPDHEAIQCFFQLEKEIFTKIKLDPDKLESYLI
jgi:uncharacterized protein